MSNPRKKKGTAFERDVKGFANNVLGAFTSVHRPHQDGFEDVGDLHGVSPYIIQCKNWKNWQAAIREGLDGAVKQARAAGERFGLVVVKRHRRGTGEAYAVQRYEDWLDFYKEHLALQREVEALRAKEDARRRR